PVNDLNEVEILGPEFLRPEAGEPRSRTNHQATLPGFLQSHPRGAAQRGFGNSCNFRTPRGNRRVKAVGEFLRTILEKTRILQAVPAQYRLQRCPHFCFLRQGVQSKAWRARGISDISDIPASRVADLLCGAAGMTDQIWYFCAPYWQKLEALCPQCQRCRSRHLSERDTGDRMVWARLEPNGTGALCHAPISGCSYETKSTRNSGSNSRTVARA